MTNIPDAEIDNIRYHPRLQTASNSSRPLPESYAPQPAFRLLEAIEMLPQPIKHTETLHFASKLVELAAYELVRAMPSEQVMPLFNIAARLENEAKKLLSNAPET